MSDTQPYSKNKSLAHIMMVSSATVTPKIKVPDSNEDFFYTGGRMVSYFPQINGHGMTIIREDAQKILSSIPGTLSNIQHIRPGNDAPDPLNQKSTVCGSIVDYLEDEEGIDIVCKNDRSLLKALGYREEDLTIGNFSSYSQETNITPANTDWIIVDKNDKTKILARLSYMDGLTRGFQRSRIDPRTGQWNYYRVDGNPVYVALRPSTFAGVGHVDVPADPTGQVYTYAANMEAGEKILSSFLPGVDSGGDVADATTFSSDNDVLNHPDLITSETKDYSSEDSAGHPDDHYAAVWQHADGTKKTALRIKDNKGNLHRGRLIAAHQALTGSRGNTAIGRALPDNVHAHALALVRQGLHLTKPTKEKSMANDQTDLTPGLTREIEELKAKGKELASQMDAKGQALLAAEAERDEAKKALAALQTDSTSATETLKAEIKTQAETIVALQDQLKEHANKALAAERLTVLEQTHPYTEDEKKEPSFEEFQKSLANMDPTRFELEQTRRELAKSKAESQVRNKALASLGTGNFQRVEPVGQFNNLAEIKIDNPADVM